jgi:hypothetical protein
VYEEWERSQSKGMIEESRRSVAVEEYREHVNSLVKVGEFLILNLEIPDRLPTEAGTGMDLLNKLWEENFLDFGTVTNFGNQSVEKQQKVIRLITRQNQMLFQSLKNHTRGKVNWEILEKWQYTWDECRNHFAGLEQKVPVLVRNFLKQNSNLIKEFSKDIQGQDTIDSISHALLRTIWAGMLSGDLNPEHPIFNMNEVHKGPFFVSLVNVTSSAILSFYDKKATETIVYQGNRAYNNLLLGDTKQTVNSIRTNVAGLRKAYEEIVEMLNPLVLRPIILRTHCELCPV